MSLVERAKIAEELELYDEMVKIMRQHTIEMKGRLSIEARNLLSVAYKKVIGNKQRLWRLISGIKLVGELDKDRVAILNDYLLQITKEILDICDEVMILLDRYLISSSGEDAGYRAFYLMMKGDYHRYMCEVDQGVKGNDLIMKTNESYLAAQKAATELPAAHPIRLGLALNYSVFFYEIMKQHEEASKLAKEAVEAALKVIDATASTMNSDSSLIIKLLQDNLLAWDSEQIL